LPGNKHGATKTGILVETKAGMALLHKHGDDCMLHEGEPLSLDFLQPLANACSREVSFSLILKAVW
jgi:hypothetical protein